MAREIRVKVEAPADLSMLRPLDCFVRRLLEESPFLAESEVLIGNLELVFNEAFMNIHDHAYKGTGEGQVFVEIVLAADRVEFLLEDEGQGFEPEKVSPPNYDHPAERGRGVWLMRHFMDEFDYRSGYQGRNSLRLVKRLTEPK